jgi:hypothetical protein
LLVDGDRSQATLTGCEIEGTIGVSLDASAAAKMVRSTLNAKDSVADLWRNASLTLTECKLQGTALNTFGGELKIKDSTIDMENGSLSVYGSSRAMISGGNGVGVIYVSDKGQVKMENTNWKCVNDCISVREEAKVELESCQIEGLVHCGDSARLEMAKCRIQTPPSAHDDYAITLRRNGKTTIGNCEILGSGESTIGVRASDSHDLRIQNSRITGHEKGISLHDNGQTIIGDCEIIRNGDSTGVLARDSHDLRILNSRITGHNAGVRLSDNVRATVEGCDLRDNYRSFRVGDQCRLDQSRNRE